MSVVDDLKPIISVGRVEDGRTWFGKWSVPGVPHRGWVCIDMEDLGEPSEICGMCEFAEIRYVHVMKHDSWPDELRCGCICAGRMAEEKEGVAKEREKRFKKAAREYRRELALAEWEREKAERLKQEAEEEQERVRVRLKEEREKAERERERIEEEVRRWIGAADEMLRWGRLRSYQEAFVRQIKERLTAGDRWMTANQAAEFNSIYLKVAKRDEVGRKEAKDGRKC